MNTLKTAFITVFIFGLITNVQSQTLNHLKDHNWKIDEHYVDSILMDSTETLYLYLEGGGSLLSDSLRLTPSDPTFLQRLTSTDSYIITDQSIYGQNVSNSLELVIDDETKRWDIIYEDLTSLILFKYDTIPASAVISGEPIIYPNEIRLVKDDL